MSLKETTGVYSNNEIHEAMAEGHIVIDPFIPKHLNGSSYDVMLGKWFIKTTNASLDKHRVYNPYDPVHISNHYTEPFEALTHAEELDKHGIKTPFENVPLNAKAVIFEPGQRMLGHTIEFIGIRPPGTTSMQARSTVGRHGSNVCQDAGWGDPGYIDRWTMELYNNNRYDHMILAVGTRIAQIVFHHTGLVIGDYTTLSGNYQKSSNLEELKRTWKPTNMLPKPLVVEEYTDNI